MHSKYNHNGHRHCGRCFNHDRIFTIVSVLTCGRWGDSPPPSLYLYYRIATWWCESQLASSIRRSSNCASCNGFVRRAKSEVSKWKQQVDIEKNASLSPTPDPCIKSKCDPALCWSLVGPVMLPFLLLRVLPFQITSQSYRLTFSPLQYFHLPLKAFHKETRSGFLLALVLALEKTEWSHALGHAWPCLATWRLGLWIEAIRWKFHGNSMPIGSMVLVYILTLGVYWW